MASLLSVVPRSDFTQMVDDAFGNVRLFSATPDNGWRTVRKIPLSTFVETRTAERARALLEFTIRSFYTESGTGTDWLLSIPPLGAEGFAVDLSKNGELYRILFGELEEEFDTLSDALNWVGRALSESYQLRVTLVGGRRREWRLEPVAANEENLTLATGSFVPFRSLRSVTSLVYRNSF
jgi:hypothetical protein